eukprot:18487_1
MAAIIRNPARATNGVDVPLREWSATRVSHFLVDIQMEEYVDLFQEHHINGDVLQKLGMDDLREIGMASVGHRKSLVSAVAKESGKHVASKRSLKIAIEGNIAAGKSTFLNILKGEIDFVVVPEPVSKWQKIDTKSTEPSQSQDNGGNLLDMFYQDPVRWSYTLQSYAFLSRMREQMKPMSEVLNRERSTSKSGQESDPALVTDGDSSTIRPLKRHKPAHFVKFFERSVYSDRFCFASNCYKSGMLNHTEWGIFRDWFSWLVQCFSGLQLDGFIYLRTTPSACLERLHKRGRQEETKVEIEYLNALHERHEEWLVKSIHTDTVAKEIRDVPILVLDTTEEFESNPEVGAKLLASVREFINKISDGV